MNTENIFILIALGLAIGFVIGYYIKNFIKLDKANQIEIVKKWLLYAVTSAQKELGSGTGSLKLAKVYNEFVATFPSIAKTLNYDNFSKLVDEVLVQMKNIISTNQAVAKYVVAK